MSAAELKRLEDRLEKAQSDLLCADMIDNGARRRAEKDRFQAIIRNIEKLIAEAKGAASPAEAKS